MNREDLAEKVRESGLSKKDAETAVSAIFGSSQGGGAISDALAAGDNVQLIGFGNFVVSERGARKGRNPQTGAEIDIAAKRSPKFKPGSKLEGAIPQ